MKRVLSVLVLSLFLFGCDMGWVERESPVPGYECYKDRATYGSPVCFKIEP